MVDKLYYRGPNGDDYKMPVDTCELCEEAFKDGDRIATCVPCGAMICWPCALKFWEESGAFDHKDWYIWCTVCEQRYEKLERG